MTGSWLRRAFAAAACVTAALLAGCGSSNTVSALTPARVIVFGDAFSSLGAGGSGKYTVNDGSVNNWTQQAAAGYGRSIASLADGGTGYAVANARVTSAVDAAGGANPSITQQITNFLAVDKFGANDLVIINAGMSDIVAETMAFTAGSQTSAAVLDKASAAGTEYGAQILRLVKAGAKFVAMSGTYDLSRSPWAVAIGQTSLLNQASGKFNDALLISTVDLGGNVLYVDAAFYFNLITGNPANYAFSNAAAMVCNSVDPGPGIGIGLGQVNSSLCTPSTVGGQDYSKFVFADGLYATPVAQRLFGDYAYSRIKNRF